MRMSPEMMQKMPPELAMLQRTSQIVGDIEILPLKKYKVLERGDSISLDKVG